MAHRFLLVEGALLSLGLVIAGCGAGTPTPSGEEGATSAPKDVPVDSDQPPPVKKSSSSTSSSSKDDALTEDQKAQMEVALRRGGVKAANCISVAEDAKPGEGEVTVVFDGKIGKATDVVVGPPWAGSPIVESCIKRAFIGEFIVPFEGKLEVPYTIKLGKGDAADPKAKDATKKDPKKDPKKK